MSKWIKMAGLVIRLDKVLAVSIDDKGAYPSINFYLSGNETVLQCPLVDIPSRDQVFDQIIKQIENE